VVDPKLAKLGVRNDFLNATAIQLSKDMGMLLNRNSQVKRCQWLRNGESLARWLTARFEIRGPGGKLGLLELAMERRQAVILAADLVKAPNVQGMAVEGPLSDMVADGMRELANVCGAAFGRGFKARLEGQGSCHLVQATWEDPPPPAFEVAWAARVDMVFAGIKEPFAFQLTVEA
jgi:hypothetical protein